MNTLVIRNKFLAICLFFGLFFISFSVGTMKASADDPDPYIRQDKPFSLTDSLNIEEDSVTGAFIFNYPIEVPKGRNGLEPDLQLEYNSQDTNDQSIFGYGWSINIPYIQKLNIRGSENLYSDNYFYSSLSGELVDINLSDDTHGSYGSKIENGELLKYEYNTDNSWTVTDKQGVVYIFGSSTVERQDDPGDSSKIYKWMLKEKRDTNNNFIRYEYYKDNGQIYPYKIFYTGYDTTDGIFEIEFLREARNDNATSTSPGFVTKSNYRISEIKNKINSNWVKKYQLSYTVADNGGRSVIDTIIEVGQDEQNNIITLPANNFDYQSDRNGWTYDAGYDTYIENPYAPLEGPYPPTGDFNADGFVDLITCTPSICRAWINNTDGTGWTVDVNYIVPLEVGYSSMPIDLNGDGFADLVGRVNNNLKAWINNTDGTGWTHNSAYDALYVFHPYYTNGVLPTGDFNGDGLPDFFWVADGNTGIYINNGSGWSGSPLYSSRNGISIDSYAMDINGDGLADFVTQDQTDMNFYINNGDATGWTFSEDYSFDIGDDYTYMAIGDLNGDGLSDFVHTDSSTNCAFFISDSNSTGWYWTKDNTNYSYPTGFGCGTHVIDVNADGLSDLFYKNNGTDITVAINNGKNSDLLSKIQYSEGSVVDVEYQPSTHEVVSGGSLANPNLPFVVNILKQVSISDGMNSTSTINYHHSDGQYYYNTPYDRKFAGFGKITKTKGNARTISYYHQGNTTNSSQGEYNDSYHKIGKPYRTEVYDNNTDTLLSQEIDKWDEYDLGNNRKFVYNTQKANTNFVGTTKSTAAQYQYDMTNGNLLTENSLGEVIVNTGTGAVTSTVSGDEKDTDYDYAYNSTKHILSAPKTKTMSDSLASKQQDIYYNNQAYGQVDKVNPTKEDYIADDVEINRSFNSYGLVYEQSDPKYATTTIGYDSYNIYPYTTTDPLSNITYTEYNLLNGQVATTTDPNGRITKNSYDAFGRPVEVRQSDKDNPSTLVLKQSISYQDTNLPRYKETKNYFDTNSYVTSREYYDGLGRTIQTKSQTGTTGEYSTVDISYDSQGRVERQSLPYVTTSISYSTPNLSQPAKTYIYDALDRVLTEVTPVGTTSYAYNGFTTTITDANGNIKDLTKDAYGNLVEVKEHNGVSTYTTSYDYSLTNKLEKITDSQGNIRNFHYDALDNLDSQDMVHIPSATSTPEITYTHDKNGNVLTETSFKDDNISYVYDDLNRVLYEKLDNTDKISYTYDLNGDIGQLSDVVYADGNSRQYDYDVLGNLRHSTTTIEGEDFVMHFDYNLNGDIKSITYPNNFVVTYGFNSAGQVTSVSLDKGQGPVVLVDNITYNQNGQMTHLERSNNVDTTYYYDPNENFRLTDLDTTSAITTLQDIHYTYDNVGNISQIADNSNIDLAKTVSYNYDDLNRLTSSSVNYASSTIADYSVNYEYDSIGNMTFNSDVINFDNFNYDNDNPHQLSSYLLTNLSYDGAGNLLDNGNISFYWDHRNRVNKSYNTSTEDYTYYEYDHNNQRLLKYTEAYVYVNPIPDPTDPVDPITKAEGLVYLATEQGPYWEWRRIKEDKYVDNYFEQNKSNQNKTHIFLNGTKIATVNHTDNPYFILSDHLNSSSILVDNTGAISEMTDYLPYGKINYEDITTNLANDYTFTGQEYDEENSLQYYGARYLDNEIGRFISIDPVTLKLHDGQELKEITKEELEQILSDSQKLNSYIYVTNNPIKFVDPDGQYGIESIKTTGIGAWQITKGLWNAGTAVTESFIAGAALALGKADASAAMLSGAIINLDEAMTDTSNGFNNIVGNAIIHDKPAGNIMEEGPYKEFASNFVSKDVIDTVGLGADIAALGAHDIPNYYSKAKGALGILQNAKASGVGKASENYLIYKTLDIGRNVLDTTANFISGKPITNQVESWLHGN